MARRRRDGLPVLTYMLTCVIYMLTGRLRPIGLEVKRPPVLAYPAAAAYKHNVVATAHLFND